MKQIVLLLLLRKKIHIQPQKEVTDQRRTGGTKVRGLLAVGKSEFMFIYSL